MNAIGIPNDDLAQLISALIDDDIGVEDDARLAAILADDPAARASYYAQVRMHAQLAWNSHRVGGGGTVGSGQWAVGGDLPSVGRLPPSSNPQSLIPNPSLPPVPLIVVDNTPPSPFSPLPSFLFSYTVAAIIFGIAGLCGWLYQVEHYTEFARSFGTSPAAVEQPKSSAAERTSPVARVTGLVDCRWERKGLGIRDWGLDKGSGGRDKGSGLPSPAGRGAGGEGGQSLIPNPQPLVFLGDKFALVSGLLQLTYDSGAKVILQGPCTYEVDSAAGGFLSLGKLTAKVGEGSRSKVQGSRPANHKSEIINHKSPSLSTLPSPLFTVTTPTAVVTDLGTEFGVEVSKTGTTTSRVFEGLVRIEVAAVTGNGTVAPQLLHENQSARVEARNGEYVIVMSAVEQTAFARKMPKALTRTLDLVDVVAGGDGFSARRDRGIDPTTGNLSAEQPHPPYLEGNRQYHRVAEIPFVDGVFVPDGSAGSMQINSAGMTFAFMATDNRVFGHIWAGGRSLFPKHNSWAAPTILDGVDYAAEGHGLLFLHANSAITFDLEAIRRANLDCRITRFSATAGNAETESLDGHPVYADFMVLVDDQARFRRRQINGYHGGFQVQVEIKPADRFLTLVAADGGNGNNDDEIVFGNPRLELQSVGSEGGDATKK